MNGLTLLAACLCLAACAQSSHPNDDARDAAPEGGAQDADGAVPGTHPDASDGPVDMRDASSALDGSSIEDAAQDAREPEPEPDAATDAATHEPDAGPVTTDDAAVDAEVVIECDAASDCPGSDDDCAWRVCEDGGCGVAHADLESPCDDGNPCTLPGECYSGVCYDAHPVVCAPEDSCHVAGVCNPLTGACSSPVRVDGSACVELDPCRIGDTCTSGVCESGVQLPCEGGAACVAGVCRATACAGTTSFASRDRLPLTAEGAGIAAGDFDDDGLVDLAVSTSTGVKLLHGRGRELFGVEAATSDADGFGRLAAVDLEDDGDLDLIVARYVESRVDVLVNAGDGTFAAAASQATVNQPLEMEIADLDGDELLDVVVSHVHDGLISVLLNAGDGTLAAATTFMAGMHPHALATGDFDDDGSVDIAVSDAGDGAPFEGAINVMLNDGNGAFAPPFVLELSADAVGIVAGDLTGDGVADIAAASYEWARVTIFVNEGDGAFADGVEHNIGFEHTDLAASDFDRDGDLDLAVLSRSDLRLMLNLGDGSFGLAEHRPAVRSPASFVIADLDARDGPDLAVTDETSHYVNVWLNDGEGNLEDDPVVPYVASSRPVDVAAHDVDFDGRPDLISSEASFDPLVRVRRAVAAGRFDHGETFPSEREGSLIVADLDRDDLRDIVVADYTALSVLPATGASIFGAPRAVQPTSGGRNAHVADVTGDGWPDLVFLLSASVVDEDVGIAVNRGNGTFAEATRFSVNGGVLDDMAVADLDGDAHPDIAVTDYSGRAVRVLFNDGAGSFGAPASYVWDFEHPTGLYAIDYDDDGDIDLGVTNATHEDLAMLVNDGSGLFTMSAPLPTEGDVDSVAPYDFDNDGTTDLAYLSEGALAILMGEGAGSYEAPAHVRGAEDYLAYASADVDADGRLDVITLGRDSREVGVLFNVCLP